MQETWVWSLGQEYLWRREWQPTLVFLPGESHGQRGLVGYSPWGCKVSDTTQRLTLSLAIILTWVIHKGSEYAYNVFWIYQKIRICKLELCSLYYFTPHPSPLRDSHSIFYLFIYFLSKNVFYFLPHSSSSLFVTSLPTQNQGPRSWSTPESETGTRPEPSEPGSRPVGLPVRMEARCSETAEATE